MRIATLAAFSALATPAAAGITLDDLDPLTRGICEQLEINAQCPVPEPAPYEAKLPTTEKVMRPKPRPEGWPCSSVWWSWLPRCARPLTFIMETWNVRTWNVEGRAPDRRGWLHHSHFGGGGGGRHDQGRGDDRDHHHGGYGGGDRDPDPAPERPDLAPVPGPDAMPIFLTALAALAVLKRRKP